MTSDQGNFPVSNETMMDKMPLNPTAHDIVMSEPETMQVEESKPFHVQNKSYRLFL